MPHPPRFRLVIAREQHRDLHALVIDQDGDILDISERLHERNILRYLTAVGAQTWLGADAVRHAASHTWTILAEIRTEKGETVDHV
jgi:hypothetical protein